MTKVHNFSGFMKNRKAINESGMFAGANPEDDMEGLENLEGEEMEGEGAESEEEEEPTIEDLKAMIDDLTERVEALEGGGEEEEESEEGEEEEEEEVEEEE